MPKIEEIRVPDIGDFDAVDVVEVLVSPGDRVEAEQGLITLESDKASMEVPSPAAGTVREVKVAVGDKVGEGQVILSLEVEERKEEGEKETGEEVAAKRGASSEPEAPETPPPPELTEEWEVDEAAPRAARQGAPSGGPAAVDETVDEGAFARAYASPAVRKEARELGVDLGRVEGSGRKGRILKEDVQAYVRRRLAGGQAPGGLALAEMPEVDFARFGEVEEKPLSRLRRKSAANVHRSWLHVPHVTQHEEADVTELEAFRQGLAEEAAARGVKLTPLAFFLKASVAALAAFPEVNASLSRDGERLIVKKYYHLGVAVDTDDGLVVPVLRDVDQKGLFDLAGELAAVAERARRGKLLPQDFQGATFTVSSLGGIGGTAFTPIVNAPEVAILGVSRMAWKPVYQDGTFVPRLLLPLSLSYDHRVVDGALACRFVVYLARVLGDLRRLLL